MNRLEYVANLSIELDNLGVTIEEKNEILEDFGRHFAEGTAQGLSEQQICEKLGDAHEIARQYVSDVEAEPETITPKTNNNYSNFNTNPNFNPSKKAAGFNAGGLVGIICLDVFVFSWAIPTLFALVLSYYAVVFSFLTTGVTLIIGSVFLNTLVHTSLSMLSVFFLGIMFLALCGLSVILGVYVFKGFVKCVKWFVNLHSQWVFGVNIITKKEEAAA